MAPFTGGDLAARTGKLNIAAQTAMAVRFIKILFITHIPFFSFPNILAVSIFCHHSTNIFIKEYILISTHNLLISKSSVISLYERIFLDASVKSRNMHNFVIPVKTGIQSFQVLSLLWIPAYAGMTDFL